tara:strand:+ start:659 stop:946 length:288 start_codon:yes stop_codon:yes gene_type:complete
MKTQDMAVSFPLLEKDTLDILAAVVKEIEYAKEIIQVSYRLIAPDLLAHGDVYAHDAADCILSNLPENSINWDLIPWSKLEFAVYALKNWEGIKK